MTPVPLVSCLMLTYNFERFVGEAIESVLAQDWPADRLQIVVVDNGSTDGSREVLARYADRVDLRLIGNVSVNEAVDVYLAAAEGDYIAFASGDDLWPPDKVAHQVALLEERPDVGLLYGDMEMIDGDGATIGPSFVEHMRIQPRTGRLLGALMERNVVSGGSVMVRGSLKPAFHPIPPEAAWEDWWIATCVARVASIAYTPHITYRYRRHGANLAFGATGERLVRAHREEIRFRRWLLETIRPGEVSFEEVGRAAGALRSVMRAAAANVGCSPAEFVPVGEEERRRAELARDAVTADPAQAVFALAAAFAANPHDEAGVEALVAALDAASQLQPSAPSIVDPAALLADARSRVVLAMADEVVADPGLLRAYAASVGAHDDATLVLFAPGWTNERVAAELAPAAAAAGVDGDESPDLLAIPVDDTLSVRTALAVRAESLLSREHHGWPLQGLPRFLAEQPLVAA